MGYQNERAREEALRGFSARLNQALDHAGVEQVGRNAYIANAIKKQFDIHVTTEAARKWLRGKGFPTQHMIVKLSQILSISAEWLMTGKGAVDIDSKNSVGINDAPAVYDIGMSEVEQQLIDMYRSLPKREQGELYQYARDKLDLINFRRIYAELNSKIGER